MLEATLQNPFTEGGTLLFEPDSSKPDGLEMPEVLVRQQNNGRILLIMENHSSLSSYLKAGRCIGTATPIRDSTIQDVTTTEPDCSASVKETENVPSSPQRTVVCFTEPTQHHPQTGSSDLSTKRLDELLHTLKLPGDSCNEEQLLQLHQLISRNADVFALEDSE